jgi:6-phosphofructokinase
MAHKLAAMPCLAAVSVSLAIASTIDNDLVGTDVSIGTSTALDTALGAIDCLRVTAASHERAFIVEVMGRHSGYLAVSAAIAGGAEAVIIPESDTPPEALVRQPQAWLGSPHAPANHKLPSNQYLLARLDALAYLRLEAL